MDAEEPLIDVNFNVGSLLSGAIVSSVDSGNAYKNVDAYTD